MDKPTFNIFGDIVQNDGDRWLDSDVIPAMVVGWLAKQGDADGTRHCERAQSLQRPHHGERPRRRRLYVFRHRMRLR